MSNLTIKCDISLLKTVHSLVILLSRLHFGSFPFLCGLPILIFTLPPSSPDLRTGGSSSTLAPLAESYKKHHDLRLCKHCLTENYLSPKFLKCHTLVYSFMFDILHSSSFIGLEKVQRMVIRIIWAFQYKAYRLII